MRIVFLDSDAVRPDEVSLDELTALGSLELCGVTEADDVPERLSGAQVAITNKVPINAEALASLPDLKLIVVAATGHNIVESLSAKSRGIPVCNVPSYSTMSVAQLTIGLMIELATGVGKHSNLVARGDWMKSRTFSFWDHPIVELDGLSLGVIGYGAIGQAVGKVASALGMRVASLDRGKPTDVPKLPLLNLLAESDFVSLHCPQTLDTAGMVDASFLENMKPTAFLINTSRGGLVIEADLAAALHERKIAGAGLDTLSTEPPKADNPLFSAPNCIITPHIGWASLAARRRLVRVLAQNIAAFMRGAPQNVVNGL